MVMGGRFNTLAWLLAALLLGSAAPALAQSGPRKVPAEDAGGDEEEEDTPRKVAEEDDEADDDDLDGEEDADEADAADEEGAADDGGYMTRYPPQAGTFELGFYLGGMFPSAKHSLVNSDEGPFNGGLPEFNNGLDIGLRLAFLPTEFLAVEGELGYIPLSTEDDASASWVTWRAHALAQLPGYSITPFAVLGTGFISSSSDTLGKDTDQAIHFGAGVKVALSRDALLRLDIRDNISNEQDGEGFPNHFEVLLGLSFVLGGEEPPPPPEDTDGDGFLDPEDDCPNEPGIAPNGCPPGDRDGDGFADPDDACPDEAGIAPDGCPDLDPDKDGINLPADKCPDVKGVAPDGCPDPDADKDGIPVPADKCPDEPETRNGYLDADGCPDEVPEKVKKFDGVLEGIEFASGSAKIRPQSIPKIDGAIEVLLEYTSIKLLIIGHTDDQGKAESNKTLSLERADAVKDYMVSKGIAADRIRTVGQGEAKPRDTNDTAAGRARNRRIEFKILTQ